jgi:hypothetical protein
VMAKLEHVAMWPESILAGRIAIVPDVDTYDVQGRRSASSFDPP